MQLRTGAVLINQAIVCLLHFLSTTMAVSNRTEYDNSEEDLPIFLPRNTSVSFNRGDTAVLVCGIDNLGTKTVIWRRASDPNPLTIGSDVYVGDPRYSAKASPEAKEWRLIIEDVQTTDAGVYECQISTRAKLIHHLLLRVNATARPERKNYVNYKQGIFVSGTKFVEKGDRIHLVCNSTGVLDSPEDLDWFKDGIKLTPDGLRQVKIDKFHVRTTRTLVSVLEVKHSKMEDTGTYVCRSSDLSITSTKVHVLNAGSLNVRRGTSATDKAEPDGDNESMADTLTRESYKENLKSRGCSQHSSNIVTLVFLAVTLVFLAVTLVCPGYTVVRTLR